MMAYFPRADSVEVSGYERVIRVSVRHYHLIHAKSGKQTTLKNFLSKDSLVTYDIWVSLS